RAEELLGSVASRRQPRPHRGQADDQPGPLAEGARAGKRQQSAERSQQKSGRGEQQIRERDQYHSRPHAPTRWISIRFARLAQPPKPLMYGRSASWRARLIAVLNWRWWRAQVPDSRLGRILPRSVRNRCRVRSSLKSTTRTPLSQMA